MKKHRIDNIRKVSGASTPEISPEQIKQSKETFVNLLTPIIEKMMASPETIRPVNESFAELARQAREGVPRQSTLIISDESENPVFKSGNPTLNKSGNDENSPKIVTESILSESDLELLRKIENGEY